MEVCRGFTLFQAVTMTPCIVGRNIQGEEIAHGYVNYIVKDLLWHNEISYNSPVLKRPQIQLVQSILVRFTLDIASGENFHGV